MRANIVLPARRSIAAGDNPVFDLAGDFIRIDEDETVP